MLESLLYPLHENFAFFNLFRYITFRTFGAMIVALFMTIFLGKYWIAFLKKKQFKQTIREDGPESHFKKKNTPTMGGVLIMGAVFLSSLLWCQLSN